MQLASLIRRVTGIGYLPHHHSVKGLDYKISSKEKHSYKDLSKQRKKAKELEVEDLPEIGEDDIQNYVLTLNTCWES